MRAKKERDEPCTNGIKPKCMKEWKLLGIQRKGKQVVVARDLSVGRRPTLVKSWRSWCEEGTDWAVPRKSKRVDERELFRLVGWSDQKEWERAKFEEKWFWRSWSVLKSKLDGSVQTQFVVHSDTREPIRELRGLTRVLFNGRESHLRTTLTAFKRSLAR